MEVGILGRALIENAAPADPHGTSRGATDVGRSCGYAEYQPGGGPQDNGWLA